MCMHYCFCKSLTLTSQHANTLKISTEALNLISKLISIEYHCQLPTFTLFLFHTMSLPSAKRWANKLAFESKHFVSTKLRETRYV